MKELKKLLEKAEELGWSYDIIEEDDRRYFYSLGAMNCGCLVCEAYKMPVQECGKRLP